MLIKKVLRQNFDFQIQCFIINCPFDLYTDDVIIDPAQGLLEKHRRLSVKSNEIAAPPTGTEILSDISETEPRKVVFFVVRCLRYLIVDYCRTES